MSPSSGHILAPVAIRLAKTAFSRTIGLLKSRLTIGTITPKTLVEAVPIRINRQPVHPLATLRQIRSRNRFFSTLVRHTVNTASTLQRTPRAVLPASAIRTALSRTTHAPFASPLRPNLTGGTLARSAGGYSLGGSGVRHFSHIPAAQAQVVQNVSTAVRAFCLNGFKARYDGIDPQTGAKRFYASTTVEEDLKKNVEHSRNVFGARGTTLEFRIAPTITSLSPIASDKTLNSPNVLPALASDFARALPSLARIHSDLTKLSSLGPLPIKAPNATTIHVRFAGCDANTVTALCDELEIRQGIVLEDEAWSKNEDKDVQMALLFPFAPNDTSDNTEAAQYFEPSPRLHSLTQSLAWQSMLSCTTAQPSTGSEDTLDGFSFAENPWNDTESTFEALRDSDLDSNDSHGLELNQLHNVPARSHMISRGSTSDYEGIEGIYRFISECESAANVIGR